MISFHSQGGFTADGDQLWMTLICCRELICEEAANYACWFLHVHFKGDVVPLRKGHAEYQICLKTFQVLVQSSHFFFNAAASVAIINLSTISFKFTFSSLAFPFSNWLIYTEINQFLN